MPLPNISKYKESVLCAIWNVKHGEYHVLLCSICDWNWWIWVGIIIAYLACIVTNDSSGIKFTWSLVFGFGVWLFEIIYIWEQINMHLIARWSILELEAPTTWMHICINLNYFCVHLYAIVFLEAFKLWHIPMLW